MQERALTVTAEGGIFILNNPTNQLKYKEPLVVYECIVEMCTLLPLLAGDNCGQEEVGR